MSTAYEAGLSAPRHAYDVDPTPERPVVRVFGPIRFGPGIPETPAQWVLDDGSGELRDVALLTSGVSHFCEDMSHNELCDICKKRHSFRYDDFFGYVCTLCEITHPLRFKQRGVNPWGSRMVR